MNEQQLQHTIEQLEIGLSNLRHQEHEATEQLDAARTSRMRQEGALMMARQMLQAAQAQGGQPQEPAGEGAEQPQREE